MAKKAQTITHAEAVQGADLASGVEVKATIPHSYDVLLETHKTKSAIIRFLAGEKFDRSVIAKFMGIKYQFVRNVLVQPIKKTA